MTSNEQRAHDRRWVVLMLIAMVVAVFLHYPLNILQFTVCGITAIQKLVKLNKAERVE